MGVSLENPGYPKDTRTAFPSEKIRSWNDCSCPLAMTSLKKWGYRMPSGARKPAGKALRERWTVEGGWYPIPRGCGYCGALRAQGCCALVIFNGEFRQGEIWLGKDGWSTRPGSRIEGVLRPCPCYEGKQSAAEAVLISAIPMIRKTTKSSIRDMTGLCPVRFLKIPTGGFQTGGCPMREKELPDIFGRLVRSLSLKPYKPNLR